MKVVALAGGVGGAKLAHGLSRNLSPRNLTVVVNTGDDFEFLGLKICPDLDTVCYTLGGLADKERGWGRAGETWHALEALQELGASTWFRVGDRDMATHIERTRRLSAGQALHEVTSDFCRAWKVGPTVLPMSDQAVPTRVETDQGVLPFQEYFVKEKCQPAVKGFEFQDADRAQPAPGVISALEGAKLVVICPSNPWVSIDPILAISPIQDILAEKPVLAVSPIIGGKAVKGPAAKMYREMGIQPSALAVARHYGALIDGLIIDEEDRNLLEDIRTLQPHAPEVFVAHTWMKTEDDRVRFGEEVLTFGKSLMTRRL